MRKCVAKVTSHPDPARGDRRIATDEPASSGQLTSEPIAERSQVLARGVILCSRSGFEQTNRDFFMVLADATAGGFVKLQKLVNEEPQRDGPLAMAGTVMPRTAAFDGVPIRRKLRVDHAEFIVRIDAGQFAHVWDGKPMSCSWYG